MSFTQITSTNLSTDLATQIAAGAAANTAVANIVSLTIRSAQVANSSYIPLDDTAANTGGGYLVITGTGFTPNCIAIIGQTNATSTSYVNSTCLQVQTQAFSAATYNIYVVDSYTGATAIKINGYTSSSSPIWGTSSTLAGQMANTTFNVNLSANSDSNITYSNTTALPAGTTLLANGYFYGTVSTGSTTTYSFDVKATDVELQDSSRTFSLTVTFGTTITPGLYTVGQNTYGALGKNDTISRSSPVQVGSSSGWSRVSVGDYGSNNGAIKTDGTLWMWGQNDLGQLGLGDTIHRSSPVQVGALTNWKEIQTSNYSAIAIKTDGTLWGWGKNGYGELGKNNVTHLSSPSQIGALTTWLKVSMAYSAGSHVIAVKTDGTLWSWGKAASGQLGLNISGNYVSRSSPTQIGAGTTWLHATTHYQGSLATKSDGTLWAWGGNSNGRLGLNDRVYRSSPVQVGTDTNWTLSRVRNNTAQVTFVLKTDGTLWGLGGRNNEGQMNSDLVNRSSPIQVGSDTNWLSVDAGGISVSGIKTDNTLWAWGYNIWGNLGSNSITSTTTITKVGTGINWANTSMGYSTMAAITTT